MNIFQNGKIGDRSAPEFEEGVIVFIQMDVLLPEFEAWSQKNCTPRGVTSYVKEELEKWK
jgi:hypothetical protein